MSAITAIAASGMQASLQKLQAAAATVASSTVNGPDQGLDGLDGLASNVVSSLQARNDVQANARVLARSDEMVGTLLDVLA